MKSAALLYFYSSLSLCTCHVVLDLIRSLNWPSDSTKSCFTTHHDEITVETECFLTLSIGASTLNQIKYETVDTCDKFHHGEFYELDFSVRREDTISCVEHCPGSIVTTLGIDDSFALQGESKCQSNDHTHDGLQSHSFVSSVRDEDTLRISIEVQQLYGQVCSKGKVILFNATLTYLPQPCRAEMQDSASVLPVVSARLDSNGVVVAGGGDDPVVEDACELLGSADAVILNKIQIAEADSNIANVRVFCGVYTTEAQHRTKIQTIRSTWGRKCSTFLAFSTVTDTSVPSVYVPHIGEERYSNMWQKVRSIWKYIHTHYLTQHDYFLLCGDDTYYIVENLQLYLSSSYIQALKLQSDGLYIGRTFRKPSLRDSVRFNTGAAGYLLDSRAVQILTQHMDTERCKPHVIDESQEDVNVAQCLAGADPPVLPVDTRDELGEQRFHISPPGVALLYQPASANPTLQEDWFFHYDPVILLGMECCAARSVSFHHLTPLAMLQVHAFLHRCSAETKRAFFDAHGDRHFERYEAVDYRHT